MQWAEKDLHGKALHHLYSFSLYMAQDAVFDLKQRSAQLEDDNVRPEKALQNAQSLQNGHPAVSSSRQAADLEK